MQRPLVFRSPLVRSLHLEQVDRLVTFLPSAFHDPLAVHLGALERPERAEDGGLSVQSLAEPVVSSSTYAAATSGLRSINPCSQ